MYPPGSMIYHQVFSNQPCETFVWCVKALRTSAMLAAPAQPMLHRFSLESSSRKSSLPLHSFRGPPSFTASQSRPHTFTSDQIVCKADMANTPFLSAENMRVQELILHRSSAKWNLRKDQGSRIVGKDLTRIKRGIISTSKLVGGSRRAIHYLRKCFAHKSQPALWTRSFLAADFQAKLFNFCVFILILQRAKVSKYHKIM